VLWTNQADIEAPYRIDEVKDIRDRAVALELYAKQAMNFEAEQRAHEIRLRAERRAGELLREMDKHPPGPDRSSPAIDLPPKLSDLGITKDQSSQWQRLAAMPKDDFEAAVSNGATTNGLTRPQKVAPPYTPIALSLWGCLNATG
jgi:hypothetical protein